MDLRKIICGIYNADYNSYSLYNLFFTQYHNSVSLWTKMFTCKIYYLFTQWEALVLVFSKFIEFSQVLRVDSTVNLIL